MKTDLDTINRNIFKPEWTNHVYLSSFYKIQDIYCAELIISCTVALTHSIDTAIKEYDLKNLFKSNELLIIYIKHNKITNPFKLEVYFESNFSYNEISIILTDYFKNENKS